MSYGGRTKYRLYNVKDTYESFNYTENEGRMNTFWNCSSLLALHVPVGIAGDSHDKQGKQWFASLEAKRTFKNAGLLPHEVFVCPSVPSRWYIPFFNNVHGLVNSCYHCVNGCSKLINLFFYNGNTMFA